MMWRPLPADRGERGLTMVELLVGMAITTVVSAMLLLAYFALSGSFSYSAKSSRAREQARQAVARMTREIRDAEAEPSLTEAAIVRARERWILLYTTFNEAANDDPSLAPHLVMFRLYDDGEIWRFEDADYSGSIAGVTVNPPTETGFSDAEKAGGEAASLVVDDVVNYEEHTSPHPPLFTYSFVDSAGEIETSSYVYYTENRVRILNVQIHVLADLNPGHSPVYADLLTSAQLRNQRIH